MSDIYKLPWKLVQNKIKYYPGGREIDRFRGVEPPVDDGCPECWVASDIPMRSAALRGDPNLGYAEVILPEGGKKYLHEVIEQAPEQILGPEHVKASGAKLGVLVKLLDAQKQLGLQSHPSRAYAKAQFDSDYGKEESWYVIGVRDDTPEPPNVLMGFMEGVTREVFEEAYRRDDLPAMEGCCHKVPVRLGDLFFISAGLPHAIGGGVFVVEVQESSDITVGVQQAPKDLPEAERRRFEEQLLGCYEYDGTSEAENLRRHRIVPRITREGSWGKETLLIGPEQTRYFSFTRLDAVKSVPLLDVRSAQVMIVLEGSGVIRTPEGELAVKKADEVFLPFACNQASIIPTDGETLSVILAKPQAFD